MMKISQAEIVDLHALQDISKRTFGETFATQNSEADLELFLETTYSVSSLEKEISHPDSKFFLVHSGDVLQGYMKINKGRAQSEDQGTHGLEVERIYVLKQFQGKGIGKTLLDYAIGIAKQEGLTFIWLGVWENNLPAIRFYEKQGFNVFGDHMFLLGTDQQRDLLMKLPIPLQNV